MSGSVGGQSCDFVRPNAPTAKKQRVEAWVVAGLTGIGAQKLGQNDSSFQFTIVKFDTDANLDTWAAAIDAMQSTVVTIVDDHGDSYTGCLIEQVSNREKSPAYHAKALGATGKRCQMTVSGRFT